MHTAHTILLNTIQQSICISEKDIEVLMNVFQPVYKTKNTYIVKDGDMSLNLYFINAGYVRCYYINEAGNEITTHLCESNEFVTAFESFLYKVPSKIYIQCTSDCMLLSITKEEHENLYKAIVDWPQFCQGVYEKQLIKNSERTHTLQILSAADRYKRLLHKQPTIVQNTSIKHLASYLGIKPQSLSRIRKEIK